MFAGILTTGAACWRLLPAFWWNIHHTCGGEDQTSIELACCSVLDPFCFEALLEATEGRDLVLLSDCSVIFCQWLSWTDIAH